MKILFLGDVVGRPGREAVKKLVPMIKGEENIDFSIANVENAAGGSGVTPEVIHELLETGLDCLTSGDHIWRKKEVYKIINYEHRLLKPANYPEITPGNGSGIFMTQKGIKVGVVNLQGRVFMEALDCPFRVGMREIEKLLPQTPLIVVDFHAEATSEKEALGWYLDGLVSAVIGTHTHVPTADEKILPKGTAYISDVGMVGPKYSILGRKPAQIIERFITQMPTRFEIAEGEVELQAVMLDIDEKTGRARAIKRITKNL
ncbi:MAG: TIGR00282 family metallophosphoesterase [Candidatus Omnitrophica bacterium]|nr:TIGR00282 family metallophosphoesterase [Candidatus Omnitrophota bacterium]MCM8793559.1 TIGR00282 family metallophosphoesterase [Candidatus Omnitrophota bacterium]